LVLKWIPALHRSPCAGEAAWLGLTPAGEKAAAGRLRRVGVRRRRLGGRAQPRRPAWPRGQGAALGPGSGSVLGQRRQAGQRRGGRRSRGVRRGAHWPWRMDGGGRTWSREAANLSCTRWSSSGQGLATARGGGCAARRGDHAGRHTGVRGARHWPGSTAELQRRRRSGAPQGRGAPVTNWCRGPWERVRLGEVLLVVVLVCSPGVRLQRTGGGGRLPDLRKKAAGSLATTPAGREEDKRGEQRRCRRSGFWFCRQRGEWW
jgi:hypothetical protein